RATTDLHLGATVLGLGRFLGSQEAFHRAQDLGISWVPSQRLRGDADLPSLPEFRSLAGTDRDLYLTLDVSALDAASAPGCANPNPDGLAPPELGTLLEHLLTLPRIRGLDLCEVNPARDPLGTTARNAAWLLSLVVSRLGEDPSVPSP
ncbi:Ureohydrolase, partial [mine drainage metagenome]